MDSTQFIFLFALKIIKNDIYRNNNLVIRRIRNKSKSKSIVENQKRLFSALSSNSFDSVINLIREGADVYGRDSNLMTTLHFASKSSNVNIIKFLINYGLNPNVKDFHKRNLLHVAAGSGNTVIVNYIIDELKITVEEQCAQNQSALHVAIENGCIDIVEILLSHKSVINAGPFFMTPLYTAVVNNKIKIVELFFQEIEDINSIRVVQGFNFFHLAAEMGLLDMVVYFLGKGADVNSVSDKLVTALHQSAYTGHLEIVATLISEGANVNAEDSFNRTPLHYAAMNGQSLIVEVLLKHGADLKALDNEGHLPLHFAIMKGNIDTLKTLLKHEASIKDVTTKRSSIFGFAIPHGNLELIDFLIDNEAPINIRDANGFTPLHLSIQSGSIDISLRLIERGAEINAVTENGFTPLSLSIQLGYFEISDKLLSEQADVTTVDKNRQSLLHMCITSFEIRKLMKSDYEINDKDKYKKLISNRSGTNLFKRLVQKGVSVENIDIFGITPLHLACHSGYIDIVQYLINILTQIDIQDKNGYTPLHYAIYNNHLEVVNILIASGKCSLKSKTLRDDTALSISSENNYEELTRFLINKEADVNDGNPLYKALMQGHQDICILLLQNKHTDIDKQFRDKGETLLQTASIKGLERVVSCFLGKKKFSKSIDIRNSLFFAIQQGYDGIVSLLLNRRADVNIVFENDVSPLHLAASRGHSEIIKILLDRGADSNKQNSQYRKPIELAVWYGHLDSVKVFFQNTIVNVNEKFYENYTLLHFAAERGHLDIVEFLINEKASLNAANSLGSKPIHVAAREGHLHIVEYFIQCDETLVTERGCSNTTLLHYAAQTGQTDIVKYLVQKGIDVNEPSDDGVRPIHITSLFGFEEVLKVLIDNGAIYDCTFDVFQRTPLLLTDNESVKKTLLMIEELFHSVKSNNISNVKSLINKGACVNAKNSKNATLLHYAAWKGNAEIVQVLLENNANPTPFGKNRATPLHYASKSGKIKIVKILLENGAMYNTMTADRKTPLDLASSEDVIALLKLIDNAFENVQNCNIHILNSFENFENSDSFKSLACAKNKEGKTLMACAVLHDFPNLKHLKSIFIKNYDALKSKCANLFAKEEFNEALNTLNNFQKKTSQALGLENPAMLESEELSAKILSQQHKYQEALDKFQAIFQKKKKMFGLNDSRTLRTHFFIALNLHCLGRNLEAMEILKDVHSQQCKLFGSDHSETLITLSHMATVMDELGRHEEALKKNNTVFKKLLSMFGPDNLLTIQAQESLANSFHRLGKYDDALSGYKCVYELRKKKLGHFHTDTLISLHNVKHVLCIQNLCDETLKDFREVLHIQEKVLGPKHVVTLRTEHHLGVFLLKRGKLKEGHEILKENVEKQRNIFGSEHAVLMKSERAVEKIDMLNLHTSADLNKTNEVPTSNESLIKETLNFANIDSDGRTILHFAASEGHLFLVNDALQNGCNVMHTTRKGNTPLHIASSKGHAEIVEKLLKHAKENNFDQLTTFINAKTINGGNSALHAAANLETVKILLKYGAIYNVQNKESKTPKDYTTVKEISDFLQLIDEFFFGGLIGDSKIISKFNDFGSEEKLAVSNARNEQNRTLIQVGEAKGHKILIKEIELILTNK
nr:serine/threonine-protein phosphatase 6 regulatory ankyrin repeat subunit A-like [Parasteatoda tepidariorum]